MQIYDYSKLLGRMRERGFTQAKMAEIVGISACSLNQMLNNKVRFRQDVIDRMCTHLAIAADEISVYFFAHKI